MTAADCGAPVTGSARSARFRQARDHMAALGARPHVAACERELALCGAEIRPEQRPPWNLTASELAVARLVCTGRSNREVAADLYVSVKAVEFHLGTSSTRSASGLARTWQTGWRHPVGNGNHGRPYGLRPNSWSTADLPNLTAGEFDQGPKVSVRVGCLKCDRFHHSIRLAR